MTLPKVDGGEGTGLAHVVAHEARNQPAVGGRMRRVKWRQGCGGVVQGKEIASKGPPPRRR